MPNMVTFQTFHMVTFQQITKILELTDRLGLNRERVEIPLSPESPGTVRTLPNGKLQIIVDADTPFDRWLASVESTIVAVRQAGPAGIR